MDIAVTPFDPSDATSADRAYEVCRAASLADIPDFPAPPREYFFGSLRHPWPGERLERALGWIDGKPVGYLELMLPERDNTENAAAELYVMPSHRRRGVGRALHQHAVTVARAAGRRRLVGSTVETLPGGPCVHDGAGRAFAAALGAHPALPEVRRRLDLDAVDGRRLDELVAGAWRRAAGYRLVRWQISAPEQYLDDIAYLDGRLLTDAPMGDLEWEPEKVDAEHVRDIESALAARGRRDYHTGVVHEASNRLVGWTMVAMRPGIAWHARQGITIVDPDHRGHRLGLVAKIENLGFARAHEPGLTTVDTFNAAANEHMIAVNDALGFRPVDAWTEWQQNL
jgi:GNAT superfamily N-acetyltransferase